MKKFHEQKQNFGHEKQRNSILGLFVISCTSSCTTYKLCLNFSILSLINQIKKSAILLFHTWMITLSSTTSLTIPMNHNHFNPNVRGRWISKSFLTSIFIASVTILLKKSFIMLNIPEMYCHNVSGERIVSSLAIDDVSQFILSE